MTAFLKTLAPPPEAPDIFARPRCFAPLRVLRQRFFRCALPRMRRSRTAAQSPAIQSTIAAAKEQHAENMQKLTDAKAKLEERIQSKKEEVEADIAEWKSNREIHKLEKRADGAEDYAIAAIEFAAASVREADLATLEAIVARLDAEDAKTSAP